MDKVRQIEELVLRSRRLPLLVIALALAVLAAVVAVTTLQLREGLRQQIAGRDGEVLYAVALTHYAEDVKQGLGGPVEEAGDELGIVLKSAEIRGVLGVRLFDAEGRFVDSFPPYVIENSLAPELLPRLRQHHPVSRFYSQVEMWRLFYPDETVAKWDPIPLLEVNVPLHSEGQPLTGFAQFLVEGQSIAAEYARLDRRLWWQALTAFAGGGAVLALALAWVFRRLNRAQRLLADRTENLVRANQELVLAAKTSALGVVAAHLIHGLKNPLAGLQNFVATRGVTSGRPEATEWEQAVASTRGMQAMINYVVSVLQEDESATGYEVTLAELEQIVRGRVQPLARERGVDFSSGVRTEAALPNRVANLVALILVNLCENAVQATPRGKCAGLVMECVKDRLVFEVRDEGSGFPADTPLFMPCRSAKEGGAGIGLALCKQLANHLGAELQLLHSASTGCVFALRLPLRPDGTESTSVERSQTKALRTGG
jgi:signal transduction histidine kinase